MVMVSCRDDDGRWVMGCRDDGSTMVTMGVDGLVVILWVVGCGIWECDDDRCIGYDGR